MKEIAALKKKVDELSKTSHVAFIESVRLVGILDRLTEKYPDDVDIELAYNKADDVATQVAKFKMEIFS